MNNPTILQIETGDVTYEMRDERGETIGTIRFNPADIDIMRRAEEVEKWLESIEVPEEITLDTFYQYSDDIKKHVDYLLNRPISGEIFKVCNPMTLLSDGRYYFVEVLKVILGVIRDETIARAKKTEERVSEAVAEITGE